MLAVLSTCFYSCMYGKDEMYPISMEIRVVHLKIYSLSHATASFKWEFPLLLKCLSFINLVLNLGGLSYRLIFKKQAKFLWGERKEHVSLISYYRSDQVNTIHLPVLHHSSSVWSIGTVSSNLGMLNPAPHIMSCTRNSSRWHRSPGSIICLWLFLEDNLVKFSQAALPSKALQWCCACATLTVFPHDEWGWICQMQWLRRSKYWPRALSQSFLYSQTCY